MIFDKEHINILILISSKSPNHLLFDCIESFYKIQIKENVSQYKICVIDSDSDDISEYEKINTHLDLLEF